METIGRFRQTIKQKPYEFWEFCREIEKIKPERIVEIGILRGGIISYFRGKVKQVVGIDIENGKSDDVIIGDSHNIETMQKLLKRLTGDIDVLFIDGDHSYKGVVRDFELYNPLVRKGGIIGLHDILDSDYHRKLNMGVSTFWNELKAKYQYREIIDNNNLDWGGIGVLYV